MLTRVSHSSNAVDSLRGVNHLYVHIPFCARRCTYCDFSIAVRRTTPVREFVDALRTELAIRPFATEGLQTVYLGGGTPSRLGGDGIAAVLHAIRERATIAPQAEITIEANPEDVTPEVAATWLRAGVTRVSLGAQSFHDTVLEWMHRVHDARRIGDAVRTLRDEGLVNISIDLIFALPENLERDWRADIDQALALEPQHVSLYGLTVEPATPLGRWHQRGTVTEAPEERYEQEFLFAHETFQSAGFEHYEVSNFALPGRSSRHNSMYWTRVPYAGFGPAAHEFAGSVRRWNVKPYAEWVQRLVDARDPVDESEVLDRSAEIAEEVYLGLRTTSGLRLDPVEIDHVGKWLEAGWGHVRESTLRLTASGWMRLDTLAADLTALRSR